jgi:hypothetical protein
MNESENFLRGDLWVPDDDNAVPEFGYTYKDDRPLVILSVVLPVLTIAVVLVVAVIH